MACLASSREARWETAPEVLGILAGATLRIVLIDSSTSRIVRDDNAKSGTSGSEPFADLFENGIEFRVATQRVEIVVFEDAFARPTALEGTPKRRQGVVAVTT